MDADQTSPQILLNDYQAPEVVNGTILAEAETPTKISLSWNSASDLATAEQDATVPGEYTATATFTLPSEVAQSDPPVTLEVTAKITVANAIGVVITPANGTFDLSNPDDVSTIITWGDDSSITELLYDHLSVPFTLESNTLTIAKDYLSSLNPSRGDILEFEIHFDTGSSRECGAAFERECLLDGLADELIEKEYPTHYERFKEIKYRYGKENTGPC